MLDTTTGTAFAPHPMPGQPGLARVDCGDCGALAVVPTDQAATWHADHRCGRLIDEVIDQVDTLLGLRLQRDADHAGCSSDRTDCDHAAADDQIAAERLALTELVYGARVGATR